MLRFGVHKTPASVSKRRKRWLWLMERGGWAVPGHLHHRCPMSSLPSTHLLPRAHIQVECNVERSHRPPRSPRGLDSCPALASSSVKKPLSFGAPRPSLSNWDNDDNVLLVGPQRRCKGLMRLKAHGAERSWHKISVHY